MVINLQMLAHNVDKDYAGPADSYATATVGLSRLSAEQHVCITGLNLGANCDIPASIAPQPQRQPGAKLHPPRQRMRCAPRSWAAGLEPGVGEKLRLLSGFQFHRQR